jgi:exonuclease SbcC
MRPIKLTMTAFGPFADSEQIDFDQLGNNPLFLINGPTGSGKTTILDAICFALYGKTTGDERQPAQMRCDHAAAESIAQVELLFELRGQRYRVLREPEQQRPKLRGEGFTRHVAKAELYRLDELGAESLMVAAKVTEANSAIEQLTGLNVEQFRQVMVLPQGEFRRLLIADSSEREAVFSQLFQTHIYKRIEYTLKDQSAALRKQLEALRNQQKGMLDSAELQDLADLDLQLQQQLPVLATALNDKQLAQTKQQAFASALTAAEKLQADFDRLARYQAELLQLKDQAGLIDQQRQQLARAQQAKVIERDYQQLQNAEQGLAAAVGKWQQMQQLSQQSEASLVSASQLFEKANSRQADIDQARKQQARLSDYVERVTTLEKARQQLELSHKQVTVALAAQQHQQTMLANIDTQLQQTAERHSDITAQLKGLTAEQLAMSKLEQQLKLRRELEDYQQQLSDCQQQQRVLASQREDATALLDQREQYRQLLELRWHRGQAALLASQLEEGSPCLVCGSEQHPQPATSVDDIPDQQQRQAASQAVDAARREQQDIINQMTALNAQQQHCSSRVDGLIIELAELADQPLLQLQQRVERQQLRLSELQNLEADEQQLSQQLTALQQQKGQSAVQLAEQQQALVDANTAQQLAQQGMQTCEAELPEAYRQAGALQQAITALNKQLDGWLSALEEGRAQLEQAKLNREKTLANQLHAEQQQQQAQLVLEQSHSHWQQCLAGSSFADLAAFQSSLRNPQQLADLQQQLQRYDQQLASAQGAVESLQQALAENPPPAIEQLKEQLAVAQQTLLVAEQHHASIDRRVSQLKDVLAKLQRSQRQLQKLDDQYAVVGTLADVANGKTGDHISLQRFVLSVLLDDVLIEASQRLKSMSKGRYELYRQQHKGRGAAASGLELMVEDAYNGKQRPVATLSGGESFMAALSLALGLSNVVQAYAGGIQLDTLFIDEGFGSLDPESLDLAVNTLIDLQASGRMVGVISHVPELKERINVRLDVISDRNGSSTNIVVA